MGRVISLMDTAGNPAFSGINSASGLLGTMTSPGYDGRTYQSVRTAEAPYNAVRLIVRNVETTGYTIGAACVAASATATLGSVTPTGSWAAVTWGGSASVSIPARVAANRPSITISDWIPLQSIARTDQGPSTAPYLFMRAYNATGPKSGLIGSTANPNTGSRNNWGVASALNRGRLFQTSSAVGDFASSNQVGMSDDSGNFSTFIYEFEALYAVRDFKLLGIGDSIMQGDVASIVACSYGFRACADASTPAKPVTWQNQGWSNMTTSNFLDRLTDLLSAGFRPSAALIPSFSPNDGAPTQAIIDTAWANCLRMVSMCQQYGITPIVISALPRSYTGSNETFRQTLLTRTRTAFPGYGVQFLDADKILASTPGGNAISGTYSSDSIHPNDAGNDALCTGGNGAEGLSAILARLTARYFV